MECKFCWDWERYICNECKEKQNQMEKDWLTIWPKDDRPTPIVFPDNHRYMVKWFNRHLYPNLRKIKNLYPDKN